MNLEGPLVHLFLAGIVAAFVYSAVHSYILVPVENSLGVA